LVFLLFNILYMFNMTRYSDIEQDRPWADSQAKPYGGECATWNNSDPKDDFL